MKIDFRLVFEVLISLATLFLTVYTVFLQDTNNRLEDKYERTMHFADSLEVQDRKLLHKVDSLSTVSDSLLVDIRTMTTELVEGADQADDIARRIRAYNALRYEDLTPDQREEFNSLVLREIHIITEE